MKPPLLVTAACGVLAHVLACNKPEPEPRTPTRAVEVDPDGDSSTREPVAEESPSSSGDPVAAPPPTNAHLMSAAAACRADVASGKDDVTIFANMKNSLKGTELPAACRRD